MSAAKKLSYSNKHPIKHKSQAKSKQDQKITVVFEEKEKNWYIPPCSDIPIYKADNDPFCPAAKIRKFNDEQKLKLKEALKTENKSERWIKENFDTKFEDTPLRMNIALRTKAFEAAANNSGAKRTAVGMNLYPTTKPALAEVEILQKIIIRERLLIELNKLIKSGSDILAILGEVIELIKAIRYETVDIIEDISQWQKQQSTLRPFLFKGVNYLLKIPSDLDYLDQYDEIVERFCFEFKNNPLAYRGGGNLISDTITRQLSITSQSQSELQAQSRVMQSEYYLQGLLKSYYEGSNHAAVDGIEVVRLHNAEKLIQQEFQRIAKQALIGQDRTINTSMSFDAASFQNLLQTQVSNSPTISSDQQPPFRSNRTIQHLPNDQAQVDQKAKERITINTARIKLERIEKLKEESDELQAMLSHVQEKISTIQQQVQDIGKKRRLVEFRFSEAKSQGKEVASQHIAAEILVMNQEMNELQLKIKEKQKESYFLTLEKKRKCGVVKKLKEELLQAKQREVLKKKIEEKIKKEGLVAALDSVQDIAMKIKSKISTTKKTTELRSKVIPSRSSIEDTSSNIFPVTQQLRSAIEEDDNGNENNEKNDEDIEGKNGDINESMNSLNLGEEGVDRYGAVRSSYVSEEEDDDLLLSPFQNGDLNSSYLATNEEEGEDDEGEEENEEESEQLDEGHEVSHSAGAAYFAVKALRQTHLENQIEDSH